MPRLGKTKYCGGIVAYTKTCRICFFVFIVFEVSGEMTTDEVKQLTEYVQKLRPSPTEVTRLSPVPLPRSISRQGEAVDSAQRPVPSPRPTKRDPTKWKNTVASSISTDLDAESSKESCNKGSTRSIKEIGNHNYETKGKIVVAKCL